MKSIISIFYVMLISVSILSAQSDTMWTRIDTLGWGVAGVETDSLNNVFVCGIADNASWRLIKYSPDGTVLWEKNFNYTYEGPQDIIIDGQNNIIIVGGHNGDILLIKCQSNGDTIWTRTYDSGDPYYPDHAYAVTTDGVGNIAVAGYIRNPADDTWDYIVLKYGPDDSLLWVRTYSSGGSDQAQGVAVDSDSNLYVTGGTDGGAVTIKYNPQGDTIWTRIYSNGFYPSDMVFDNNGDLIVVGDKIIKYNQAGDTIWVKGTPYIYGRATDIDSQNNIYIIADTDNNDILIGKYNSSGDSIWIVTYDNVNVVAGYDIKLDRNGNIIVGGFTYDLLGDFLTIKYNADAGAEEKKNVGHLLVLFDYSIFPNPIAGQAEIRFSTSTNTFIRIIVYDVAGRMVDRLFEGVTTAGHHVVKWPANDDWGKIPSGIYFCRLECDGTAYFKKIVIKH